MAEVQLKDPIFVKLNQIQAGKHCYNVYAKVIRVVESERVSKNGEKVKVIEGTVADETASADFKFVGEHTKLVTKDAVIAIRNGRSSVVTEHIALELDKFGKITLEKEHPIEKVNTDFNISSTAYVRKSRGPKNN